MENIQVDYGAKALEASERVSITCVKYAARLKDYELKHIRATLAHIIDELGNPHGHTQGIYVGGRDSEAPMANTSKAVSAFIRHYNRYYRTKNVESETRNAILDNLQKGLKVLGQALVIKRRDGRVSEHAIIVKSMEYMNGTCSNWERPFSEAL